jgi:hypothetical protein
MVLRMEKLLLAALTLLAAACSGDPDASRRSVDRAAAEIQPSEHENDLVYGSRVFSCPSDTDCQVGLLKLGSGEEVEFWFHSHHRTHDIGCTRFEFPDGAVRYLRGVFCCEVMIEDADLENRVTLERFIETNDGTRP